MSALSAGGTAPGEHGHELEVDVDCRVEPNEALPSQELVHRLAAATIAAVGTPAGQVDLGVVFAEPRDVAGLNAEHRGIEAPTDVLSFPIDGLDELPAGMPRQLGDVVICPPYVEQQVREGTTMVPAGPGQGGDETLADALARCVVHGVLHLLGHDHEQGGDEAARMFELEEQVLLQVRGR